jgi:hypothetical protein
MTATTGDGPIGWVLDSPGEQTEAEAITKSFLDSNRELIDRLVDTIGAAAAEGDGDSLMLWLTTLRGLAGDVERILTERMVGVVTDAKIN